MLSWVASRLTDDDWPTIWLPLPAPSPCLLLVPALRSRHQIHVHISLLLQLSNNRATATRRILLDLNSTAHTTGEGKRMGHNMGSQIDWPDLFSPALSW
jgi:hypothetical protein